MAHAGSGETLNQRRHRLCPAGNQGVMAAGEPSEWKDQHGVIRKTPKVYGPLSYSSVPSHRALREYVLWNYRNRCASCDAEGSVVALVIDHIISRRNGGSHHPSNLQLLCVPCNSSKAGLIDRLNLTAKDCPREIAIPGGGMSTRTPWAVEIAWQSRAVYWELARWATPDGECVFASNEDAAACLGFPVEIMVAALDELIGAMVVVQFHDSCFRLPQYAKEHAL